jgi:cell division protein FtsW
MTVAARLRGITDRRGSAPAPDPATRPPATPLGPFRAPVTTAAGAMPLAPRLPTPLGGHRVVTSERTLRGPARMRHEPDYGIIVAVFALVAIGVLMIYSSSAARIARAPTVEPTSLIFQELVYLALGVVAMVILIRMDYRWMRVFSIPAYLLAAALLFIVLMPPFGPFQPLESGQSARWLRIADLPQVHPAEVAKLALVIYLAHWLARRGSTVGSLTRGLLPFLLIAGPIIGLVALEPDLGTTGVITLSAFLMFFVAGGSILQLLALAPLGIVALITYVLTNTYQLERWHTFLDPFLDPLGDGFHTVQGLYALALGGITGSGLGESRGPGGLYLPNADNDYVYAMVGQELGLVGGLVVIGLFLFFAYRGVLVAMAAPDTFGGLLAMGITAWLTLQAFLNIAVVVQLIPVTGITLPFVSSGGTSLVVSLAAVGILLSISRETQPRGTTDDADPDRGRGNGRPSLPGAGGAAQSRSTPA